MAEEEKEEVRAFLNKLKTVDPSIYVYQRDVVLDSHLVKSRILDHSEALTLCETKFRNYNGRAPFQGMNVGNAKNMSLDDLEKITNNFSDKTEHATLYHGFMEGGHCQNMNLKGKKTVVVFALAKQNRKRRCQRKQVDDP